MERLPPRLSIRSVLNESPDSEPELRGPRLDEELSGTSTPLADNLILDQHLSRITNENQMSPQIRHHIFRLYAMVSRTMSLQNEWIQAIEYHVPEKWPNDPTEVWTQMVGVTPPKGYHFLSWSFPYTNRHKSKCARTLIYWIYGHMIKKFDPNQVLKPGDIDIWLADHVTGLNIEKAKRVRNLASKYLKVISALGPGVVFCNQISDKAEKIKESELEDVIVKCKEIGKHRENLNRYDDLAKQLLESVL